jgi:hypothetical protein
MLDYSVQVWTVNVHAKKLELLIGLGGYPNVVILFKTSPLLHTELVKMHSSTYNAHDNTSY